MPGSAPRPYARMPYARTVGWSAGLRAQHDVPLVRRDLHRPDLFLCGIQGHGSQQQRCFTMQHLRGMHVCPYGSMYRSSALLRVCTTPTPYLACVQQHHCTKQYLPVDAGFVLPAKVTIARPKQIYGPVSKPKSKILWCSLFL